MTVNALEMSRGERTRSAILQASRDLFLQRGFNGTPINAITEACGISRAGFYTYFKDKREIFDVLGRTAYHDALNVIERCKAAIESDDADAVREWVREYFAYMDRHGAFVTAAAHTAPDDEAFRRSRNHMMTRAAWKLGQAIRADGPHSPEVIGVTAMGMLDRAWYAVHTQSVAVDRAEMIAACADSIAAMSRY
ncbi:TetR/AcrR family transcriptional regulator [Mycolicibacterium flavescens]|uniref:TetR family transcriptional regulator n=1 Tax=Mycolicibacterium flavescens TaxID=1776 RepID=A0A1E3RHK1_MYCFV|nr:TetR/AcrR family transcriptional regulator [Mycolicibacterium flavescens]MCV7280253.1 TetR/AcrR family transcriptional regulator [Mycolicibacterium flavescens]ODQ89340.1 TetR family transcriptional regulator [Mycolicibacterium flavescens]